MNANALDPKVHRSARPEVGAISRRTFLRAAAGVAGAFVIAPRRVKAAGMRTLAFRHLHTGESLSVAYASGDRYAADALARVNWLLRDFRTGESHPIDPALLDQLHALASVTRSGAPFEVISGYRSPATNRALQRTGGGGVASGSLHLEGRAIDIRVADVPLADLRDAALSLKAGGVGFYPQSKFVHVDTGRVRRW